MSQLYILSGPGKGGFFKLREGVNFLGRSLDNDIRIEDRTVSRKHLKIVKRGDKCLITDLKSKNGTYFAGNYLAPGDEVGVEEGIPIAIGITVFCLGEGCKEQITFFQDTMELRTEAIQDSAILPKHRGNTSHEKPQFHSKVSDILAEDIPIKETLEKILEHIFHLLKRIDRGAFILVDPETKEIKETISKSNLPGDESAVHYSRRVVNRVLEDRMPVIISNVQTEDDELVDTLKILEIECVMCVPIISRSEIIGVIYVDSQQRPHGFREEDLSLFKDLGQRIAFAIEDALFASEISEVIEDLSSDS